MKIGGFDAKRHPTLRWRYGDPARDLTLDGEPVKPQYVVIVRLKDCRIWTCVDPKCGRGGPTHQHYDPKDAPQAVRLNYGGTSYGYGEWYLSKPGTNGKRFDEEVPWCGPAYYVRDGYVYKSVQRRSEPPEHAKLRLFAQGIIVGKGRVLA